MVNGLSGQRMLIGLAIGIIVLIFLVLKTKVQAFLALIICTIIVGVVGGMPLVNITLEDGKTFGIINSITTGFGGTLGSIGIIIGFGVMMGQIFEATGAAKRMAHTFLRLFGKKREEEALALTGFLVSIPIFCDSGFVVLAPIAKAISKFTKKSVIGLGVALAAGLVITHSLVPPTPGPLGVCGIFGIDVGRFILLSIVLALPMTVACIAYTRLFLSKKYYQIPNEEGEIVTMPYQEPDYTNAFSMEEKGMPGTLEAFMPLIVPIVLILINTVASAFGMTSGFMEVLIFLGQPIVAVGLGLLVAIFTLGRSLDRHEALAEMEKGMMSAGIIMLVTGGGGALGQIIKDSGLGTFMAEGLVKTAIPIVVLPLLISTAMRFIQGSGTVAMTTAASISAPIIIASGASPLLGAVACCVGSLFFGYFNDSYFWVVNRTLGVKEAKDQLITWSVTSTIAWAVGVVEVLVLNIFM
ncbi:GntP family permease [Bariatricus massiliensis]|uniref:GntP family permease n=1 Tax=Bariatricus massiliensis TaxID=1745713 RepID=A0ABS8DLF5_9FIRM|nr:GntP family permease [Bariatricus massiliensis]MCB7303178.1 GntP family permease [Bariatricus massiliensis]MCB7376629.1 GntP family permease [Bariatricus massiliensis]MCB7389287.1 GntP family permease [Bariatricus massiliensis]MCB7413433.1 GntP family permease [Bariatricus massiliensis]MCQ5252052.1 GntP family permease [Bariatricus massiliensis]